MISDFAASSVLVVGLVGALTLLVGVRRPFAALGALVLLIPFRDFSTRWLNVHSGLSVADVTAIGRWWFAVIGALLILAGLQWIRHLRRVRKVAPLQLADTLLGLVVVFAGAATLASPDRYAAFTSLRGYLQPIGVYLIARSFTPGRTELRLLLYGWLGVGLVMAVFGLVQAISWTETDYRREGYVRQSGELVVPHAGIAGRPYLRPASTVSGPNELGLDMVVLLSMAALWLVSVRRSRSTLALAFLAMLFTAGLGVSASRSGLLAFVVATAAMAILYWNAMVNRLRSAELQSRVRFLLAVAAAIAIVAVLLGSSGLITLGVETVRSFAQQYHYLDSVEAIRYLAEHPAGVGMGLVEPKGALALIEAGGTYHVEGSLFQIAMEMGIWGLAAWLAFWGVALARIYRNFQALNNIHLRVLTGTAFAGWLGSLVAFLFLPLMQSISLMVWLWFLLGLGYQSRSIEAAWQAAEPAQARS